MEIFSVKPKLSMQFNPSVWNGPNQIRRSNCLAYALDEPELGGPFIHNFRHTEEVTETSPEKEKYRRAVFKSSLSFQKKSALLFTIAGLEIIRPHQYLPSKRHIIAFVGYHFYRMDGDRTWSHKSGDSPAINMDHTGKALLDPPPAYPKHKSYGGCELHQQWLWQMVQTAINGYNNDPTLSIDERRRQISSMRQLMKPLGSHNKAEKEEILYLALPEAGIGMVPKVSLEPA